MSDFTTLMARAAQETASQGPIAPLRVPRTAFAWLLAGGAGAAPVELIDAGLADTAGASGFGSAMRDRLLDERHPLFSIRSRRGDSVRELELLVVDGIGCIIEDVDADELAVGIVSPGEFGLVAGRWLGLHPVPQTADAAVAELTPQQFAASMTAGNELVTVSLRESPMLDLLVLDDGAMRALVPGDGRVSLHPIGPVDVLLALERILGGAWSAPDAA